MRTPMFAYKIFLLLLTLALKTPNFMMAWAYRGMLIGCVNAFSMSGLGWLFGTEMVSALLAARVTLNCHRYW